MDYHHRLPQAIKALKKDARLPEAAISEPVWGYFPIGIFADKEEAKSKDDTVRIAIAILVLIPILALSVYVALHTTNGIGLLLGLLFFIVLMAVAAAVYMLVWFFYTLITAASSSSKLDKDKQAFAVANKGYLLTRDLFCAFLPNIYDNDLDLDLLLPLSDISAVKLNPKGLAIYTNSLKPQIIPLPRKEAEALKINLLAMSHQIINGDNAYQNHHMQPTNPSPFAEIEAAALWAYTQQYQPQKNTQKEADTPSKKLSRFATIGAACFGFILVFELGELSGSFFGFLLVFIVGAVVGFFLMIPLLLVLAYVFDTEHKKQNKLAAIAGPQTLLVSLHPDSLQIHKLAPHFHQPRLFRSIRLADVDALRIVPDGIALYLDKIEPNILPLPHTQAHELSRLILAQHKHILDANTPI